MVEQPAQVRPALPVPKYIWNLYSRVQNEDIDSIRHYYPQTVMEANDKMLLLRYNLTVSAQNSTDEVIISAVLKLKLSRSVKLKRVKVHEIDQQNPDILRLIDSRQLEPETKKDHLWIDMDVSEALTRRRPNMDRVDFAVEITNADLTPASPFSASSVSGLSSTKTKEAALVVYIQSSDASRVRRKRRTNEKRRKQQKSKNARITTTLCHRRELLIDFRQLGWNDWIIAPENYKAYQCQGECPYPLPNSMNTTNHAIVQGILSSINPEKVPPPCCVPIEMGSLPLLYTDVDGTIVVKKYPDMQVKTCGCR
uniref:TGF_BETA_2 domain-containing protein n=1 Tax=Syphacia muris TaxID=451379 RepID=A0A0N5AY34_9BILA